MRILRRNWCSRYIRYRFIISSFVFFVMLLILLTRLDKHSYIKHSERKSSLRQYYWGKLLFFLNKEICLLNS